MNKTFNINLGSYPFAIDEDAYIYVQNYLDTIRRHFSSSEGCEEILYDIEVRMAELFQEHLKGRAIISMKEIDEVIMIMGKPEDFGAEPMTETFQAPKNKKQSGNIKTGKRLFRDPDDKKLGGVVAGIAAYFGISDPLWLRIFFALMAIFSGGFIFIAYMILWFLVPEAASAGDKLAMRGEPTTINNIAKVVEEELNDLGDKINEWSKDMGGKKKSDDDGSVHKFKARAFFAGGVNIFGQVASGIIPVIRNVIKPILITVAIIVLSGLGISWAASFIGMTIAAPILMAMGPNSGLLSSMGVGSLFFTVGLPILGVMLLISRLAFSYRINKNIKTGLWTAWFLALFITVYAGANTIKSYRSHHMISSVSNYDISDQDIKIVMPEENLDHAFGVHLDKMFTHKGNLLAVRDVRVKIEKSKDATVHIEKFISSRGDEMDIAQQNTQFVGNEIKVTGNEISISKYLTIPQNRKYRNQKVEYIIYVPEGKNIILDNNIRESLRPSELLSWENIYSDIEGLKWTVKGNSVFSEQFEDQNNHRKEISTGTYNKIIIEDAFDIIIKKSKVSSVFFTGNKDLVEKVTYKNLDGTLTVLPEEKNIIEDITIIIETPSLELIHLNGVKSATIDGFNQDNLKIFAKDGDHYNRNDSKIQLTGNIKNLDISMDGKQNLTMIGEGKVISAVLNNGANIYADKFLVDKASITGDHTYESSFYIQKELLCKNPEHIDFKVFGNPKIAKL